MRNVLFAKMEDGVRTLWGQNIARNTRIWRDVFPEQTTVFASEALARAAQPADSRPYEPREVFYLGKGAWVNACVAVRDGCLTQMANIPDAAGQQFNAQLRWDYARQAMSLWSVRDIIYGPVIVSSYGRGTNRLVRKNIRKKGTDVYH